MLNLDKIMKNETTESIDIFLGMPKIHSSDIVTVQNEHERHVVEYIMANMAPKCWGNIPTTVTTIDMLEDKDWWVDQELNPQETLVMSFVTFIRYFAEDLL